MTSLVRIPERDVSCPGHATNWQSTAFSPVTRLYYVQATEQCIVRPSPGSWKTERPRAEPATRYLRALDIETGKIVGDPAGRTVDERDGKALWRVPLNATSNIVCFGL